VRFEKTSGILHSRVQPHVKFFDLLRIGEIAALVLLNHAAEAVSGFLQYFVLAIGHSRCRARSAVGRRKPGQPGLFVVAAFESLPCNERSIRAAL
jgi:hypothetical protein